MGTSTPGTSTPRGPVMTPTTWSYDGTTDPFWGLLVVAPTIERDTPATLPEAWITVQGGGEEGAR